MYAFSWASISAIFEIIAALGDMISFFTGKYLVVTTAFATRLVSANATMVDLTVASTVEVEATTDPDSTVPIVSEL